jgi:hypothetical protein
VEVPTPVHKSCPNCGGQNTADALFCEECGYDFTTGQLPPVVAAAPPAAPAAAPASLTNVDWVAEIWIDPDFFAAQKAAGVCPTGGAPTVVPLAGPTAIIGRHSSSSGTAVEIDCSGDSAASHRHAKLTLDHDELTDSERIYIGAWTRIVIRRATPEEKAAPAG